MNFENDELYKTLFIKIFNVNIFNGFLKFISIFFFKWCRITVLFSYLPFISLQSFRKLYWKLRFALNFQSNRIMCYYLSFKELCIRYWCYLFWQLNEKVNGQIWKMIFLPGSFRLGFVNMKARLGSARLGG